MMTNRGLIFLAAAVWSGVGIMLNGFAVRWFPQLTDKQKLWAIIVGLIIGIVKTIFVFKKLIDKNVNRIKQIKEKVPFWKFQRAASYYMILGMMALGIFLRTSGLVEKKYLAPVYIGIGTALFFSSFFYYKEFFKFTETSNK